MKYISLLALWFIASVSQANSSLPNNRHIVISGEAKLEAKPDIALVYLDVEAFKLLSKDAKQEVDDRVNNLLDGLSQFNVDKKNVSAANISTYPKYNYAKNGKQELIGYTAKRSLKVTINNIKQLNAFMDFALKVKINSIRNIELKSSKAEELRDEVNALAVENAKIKGRSLAKAFDAKLGKIYSINANSNQNFHRYGANSDIERVQMSLKDKSRPGQYLQENIVFNATINVVFDLQVD